jgi:hypothetical protein
LFKSDANLSTSLSCEPKQETIKKKTQGGLLDVV